MTYALDVELFSKALKVGLYKVERPEIDPCDFAQYARIPAAPRADGPDWYAAVCLAGAAELCIGEVKALHSREDVDRIAKTITVWQPTCHAVTTPPKGLTRRTVPKTSALEQALRGLAVAQEVFVVCNADGSARSDGQWNAVLRLCSRAGLPLKRWHALRPTFGTHAALLGMNPWPARGLARPQADRRDDGLRLRCGEPSARDPGAHLHRSSRRAEARP